MGVGRHIADKHSCQSGVGVQIYILYNSYIATQNSQKEIIVQDDNWKIKYLKSYS